RTTARVDASIRAQSGRHLLDVFARLQFFAGSATVCVDLTIRNPRRAAHPGGFWELGDAGSGLLQEAPLELALGGSVDGVWCSVEGGAPFERCGMPFELYQDSSGGEHWQSSNHVNRDGQIPLVFRGYRVRAGERETTGLRACPIIKVTSGIRHLAFTM